MGKDAFERAVGALAHRERTTTELEAWLVGRGHRPEEIADTLTRLIEIGELDDERFARRYAEDKRELSGWGPERIREALRGKGLSSPQIERALATADETRDLERAISLLERRGEPLEDERSRARALAFLARRGYNSELAYDAVRSLERRRAA